MDTPAPGGIAPRSLFSLRMLALVLLTFAAFGAAPDLRTADAAPPVITCPGGNPDQIIDQPLRDGGIVGTAGFAVGQSFTVTTTGTITSIAVHSTGTWSGSTLRIYTGAGPGGTQIHSQPISSNGTYTTHTMTATVSVTPGVYTYMVDDVAAFQSWEQRSGNVYTGGIAYNGSGTIGNTDLKFNVTIAGAPGTSITEECDDPLGTVVTFTPTVTDDDDPNPTVVCVPASGSPFSLGTTAVTCTATDAGGDSSTCTFDVIIEDTTPPEISCPANITAECVGGSADVTFTVTATDLCDGATTVTCTPPSGSTFLLGTTTTVNCTTSDSTGNPAACSFTVTVVDNTPPDLTPCPGDITVECIAGGNTVTYTAPTAFDDCDGPVAVTCTPASGSLFFLGTTTVTCSATDAAGNVGSCTFDVIVEDTRPPVITCALTRTLLWPPRNGLLPIGFSASALDECEGAVDITVDVFSDEPNGAAPYSPDAIGTTPATLRLRAERQYPGDGRVYIVRVTAVDATGNRAVECKSVVVPALPYGSLILGVMSAALVAEADCAAAPTAPPASTPELIHSFTTTVMGPN